MTTEKPDVIAASSFRDAQFEPRRTSRFIADALRAAIVEGSLLPGEPLRQDTIARQFSVRAIPVREALRQLDSEAWLTIEPNRGASASLQSADEARAIYEIRASLESLAIEHHTPEPLVPAPSNRLASAEAKRTRAVSIEARRQMAEQWDAS